MNKIHSTSIIDKNAKIHESVEIGPYSIIGPNVTIDENCIIGSHCEIKGHTTIGKNNHIFKSVSIGEIPQHTRYNGEDTKVIIGDNNNIREFSTIHLATSFGGGVTSIGNNNLLMVASHIAHDCSVGNNIIFSNNVALGGHVVVKDWVVFGAYAIVHQFSLIGEHVMVAGATAISQDVPPYVIAFGFRAQPKGINIEGLKRRSFTSEQINNIKNAYRILYRNNFSLDEAKEQILNLSKTQNELNVFNIFFQQTSRSIIR